MSTTEIPAALPAPAEDVVLLNEALMAEALKLSRQSARQRIILPLHKSADAPLHRMMNVMQPDTYVRPHRHLDPPKAESVVVLRGRMWVITFTDDGVKNQVWELTPGLGDFGVDIEPGVFHTFVVGDPDTVMFEVKPGPYVKATDKDFASWAPMEGDPGVPAYRQRLQAMIDSAT